MNELSTSLVRMGEIDPRERAGGAVLPAGPRAALRGPKAPHLLRDELLSEIFAATAAAHPHALAMTTLERRFTYAEVDAMATAIARGLFAHGAGPGDVVGLWMARGPELLIAQLAIAKTGAAWLPFDADAPVERIAVCLDDAEVAAAADLGRLRAEGRARCRAQER